MKTKNKDSLEILRHSTEHVLAQAMLELYPGKLLMAMGPATDEGFYFDFEPQGDFKVNEELFPEIEKKMQEIIKKDLPFKREDAPVNKIRKLLKDNPYKRELLDKIKENGEKASVYHTGNQFVNLCRGPHLKSTGQIKAFKLLSVAGAYWHGDEKNKMLTRIYGTAFFNRKELEKYLWQLEEAKKRDHRKLGKDLELFIFDDEVGQGLPLWLPKGAFVRHKVKEFAFNTYLNRGYQPVSTPHIATEALWSHSGHLDFYKDSMYSSFGIDDKQYRLKPMNCPMHIKLYQHRPRSYRELPLRWTEMGTVYRYEKSGTLHGTVRVRGFTQDDAHIICTPDQLHTELIEALDLTFYILKSFGFKDFEVNLSTRDPKNKDKFAGTDKGWQMAQDALKKALKAIDQDYVLDTGGAVFYGPKIDIKVSDSIGRKWQLSTIQFDFNLPDRFKMTYIGKDGKNQVPYMIHRALLGSLERFMGVYIEHTGGAFPVWISPLQVKTIPITDDQKDYAQEIGESLNQAGIRNQIDDHSSTMQAKIRDAQNQKIPYLLIVGPKEANSKNQLVSVRQRDGKDLGPTPLDSFIKSVKKQVETKDLNLIK